MLLTEEPIFVDNKLDKIIRTH